MVFTGCESLAPSPRPFELADGRDPIVGGVFGGPGSTRLFAGLAVGSLFIVGGERIGAPGALASAVIWTSPDGTLWEPATSPDGGFDLALVSELVTNGEIFVAFGNGRTDHDDDASGPPLIWRSSDGREWERIVPLDPDLQALMVSGIAADPSGFVAWGTNGADAPQVLVSQDAIEWRQAKAAAFGGGTIRDIVRAPDGYVAVGSSGTGDDCTVSDFEPARAWWSADAITWQAAPVDKGAELYVAYPLADGLFASGMPSGCGFEVTQHGYWQSGDGRSWTLVQEDRSFMEVFASDGTRVVAWDRTSDDFSFAGPGPMQASLDGLTWAPIGIVDTAKLVSDSFIIGKEGILVILRDLARSEAGVQFIPYR